MIKDEFFVLKTNEKSEGIGEVIGENDVLRYIKKLPIKIIGSSVSAIKLAVSIYGGANVKLAIEKALEVNKPRMNYINGILQNWKSEGYPSSNNYTNKFKNKKPLSFNNFEPRYYDYNTLEKALLGW